MNWLVLGGSLVAVLALAGTAWALKLGRDAPIETAEEAAHAVEAALIGFDARGALLGADGLGALAVGRGGRVAVVKRHGANIAVREVPWTAILSTPAGIVVETGERRFGRVALPGVDALEVRRLAPQLTRV